MPVLTRDGMLLRNGAVRMAGLHGTPMTYSPSLPRQRTPPATVRLLLALRHNYLYGTLSIFSGLVLWEIFSRYVVANTLFLASPLQICGAIIKLTKTGELPYDIGISSLEFLVGYVIASVIGIAIGVGMAANGTIKQMTQPWVSGLYATPIIALAPLFILWFGIGIWSKVAVVVSLVVFPVVINTEAGLRNADRQLIEAVRSFGANKLQLFLKVSLPCA